jgi:hypothetical protein
MNGTTSVYLGVSTVGQRLDAERLELDRYCQQRGWHKTWLYEETASGAKASRPPRFRPPDGGPVRGPRRAPGLLQARPIGSAA